MDGRRKVNSYVGEYMACPLPACYPHEETELLRLYIPYKANIGWKLKCHWLISINELRISSFQILQESIQAMSVWLWWTSHPRPKQLQIYRLYCTHYRHYSSLIISILFIKKLTASTSDLYPWTDLLWFQSKDKNHLPKLCRSNVCVKNKTNADSKNKTLWTKRLLEKVFMILLLLVLLYPNRFKSIRK